MFLEERKGYHKGTRGTVDLPYIDQHILKESKAKKKNVAMVWIDYKTTYDMTPKSWIVGCLKI